MSARLIKAMIHSESVGEKRGMLASRLGVGVEALDSLQTEYEAANGPGSWDKLVIEMRAQQDIIGGNWDTLEAVALDRLVEHTQMGRVTTVSDLLAIARTANQASRRGGGVPRPVTPNGNVTNIGIVLPGNEGGVMELRLTRTAAQQIESSPVSAEPIEANFERIQSPMEIRKLAEDIKE